MKKGLLFAFATIIFYCRISAQSHTVGLNGGLSRNGVINYGYAVGQNQNNNFAVGINYEACTKMNIRLGAELLYDRRGFDLGYTVITTTGDYTIKNQHHINYLSVPLKIGYQIGNRYFMFADVGICPSYKVKSTLTYPLIDSTGNSIGSKKEHLEDINNYDIGGFWDCGLGYNLYDKFSIVAVMRRQRSFWNFSDLYAMKHQFMTISLAFRYKL